LTALSLTSAFELLNQSIASFAAESSARPCGFPGCNPTSAIKVAISCNLDEYTRGGTVFFFGGLKAWFAAKDAPIVAHRLKSTSTSRAILSTRAFASPKRSARSGMRGSSSWWASGCLNAPLATRPWQRAWRRGPHDKATCTFLSARPFFNINAKTPNTRAGGSLSYRPALRSSATFCNAASRKFQLLEKKHWVTYSPNIGINVPASLSAAAGSGSGWPKSSRLGTPANGWFSASNWLDGSRSGRSGGAPAAQGDWPPGPAPATGECITRAPPPFAGSGGDPTVSRAGMPSKGGGAAMPPPCGGPKSPGDEGRPASLARPCPDGARKLDGGGGPASCSPNPRGDGSMRGW